jgi:NADH:ubiquinone oxidoreductase subunit C
MNDVANAKEARPVNDIKSRIDRMVLKSPKPRLITIIAVDNADGTFELIYAFHYNNQYTDVRFTVKAEDELESLSSYYAAAVNMEREIVDMMGLHFKGIEGGMLLMPEKGIVNPLRKPLKPPELASPVATEMRPPTGPGTDPKEVKP